MITNTAQKELYFVKSSHCEVTIGASRSLITDFQRNKLYSVSNTYGELLQMMEKRLISELLDEMEAEEVSYFTDFLDFLLKAELGFLTAEPELFPPIAKIWNSPSKITNAILDFDGFYYDYRKALSELDLLNCKNLQLRFYKNVPNEILIDILNVINELNFTFLEIYCPYTAENETDFYKKLLYEYSFLSYCYIFNSPEAYDEQVLIKEDSFHPINFGTVYYIDQNIKSEKGCGLINEDNMNFSSRELYNENLNYNGCLNRKISVTKAGEIKNCPSLAKSFGNIATTSLLDVINQPEFYKLFNITKNQIQVCRDCEYRANCTDCRAYVDDTDNIYSKPLKCGYDPYTNTWEEWSTNNLKQQAINLYGFDTV